jgi:hypothetical protein
MSTMGDCYFSPSIFLCPLQRSQGQGLISIRYEGKIIIRLSWYAFDRYEKTKGIKLKKMTGHVFPRLG